MSPDTVLDAALRDADDQPTSLRAQLHDGPLLVVFLRHFG